MIVLLIQLKAFSQLQELIDNANDGDTILIEDGIYYENIEIGKSLTLIAKNPGRVTISGAYHEELDWVLLNSEAQEKLSGAYDSINFFYSIVPWQVKWVMLKEFSLLEFDQLTDLVALKFKSGVSTVFGKQSKGIEGFAWSDDTLYVRTTKEITAFTNQVKISRDLTKVKSLINIKAAYTNVSGIRFEMFPGYTIILNANHININECSFQGCKVAVYGNNNFSNDFKITSCDYSMKPIYDLRLIEGIDKRWWRALYNSNLHSFFISILSGDNIKIMNNYVYDSYDCIELKGESTSITPKDTSIIAYNAIRRIVDNPIELDVSWRETKVRVHNNFIFDSFTHISLAPFQSQGGFALIDHNIFYNSKEEGHPQPAFVKNCYFNPEKQLIIPQQNITIAHNTVVFFDPKNGNISAKRTNLWVKGCSILEGKYRNNRVENNIFILKDNNGPWPFDEGYDLSDYNFILAYDTVSQNLATIPLRELNNPRKLFYLDLESSAIDSGFQRDYEFFHTSFNKTDLGAIEYGDVWSFPKPGPKWVSETNQLPRSPIPASIGPGWLGF